MDSSTIGLEGLASALGRDTKSASGVITQVESVPEASEVAQKAQEELAQARREGQLLDSIHQLLSECRKLAFDALNAPEGEPREVTQRHLGQVLGLVDDITEGRALPHLDLTSAKGAVAAVTEIERTLAEISRQQWRLEEFQKRKSLELASTSAATNATVQQIESQPMQDSLLGLPQLDQAIRGGESGKSTRVEVEQGALPLLAK